MQSIPDLLGELVKKGIAVSYDKGRLKYVGPIDGETMLLLQERRSDICHHFSTLKPQDESRASAVGLTRFGEGLLPIPRHLAQFWDAVRSGELGLGYTNAPRAGATLDMMIDREILRDAISIILEEYEILAARTIGGEEGECLVCDVPLENILTIVNWQAQELSVERFNAIVDDLVWQPFDVRANLFRVFLVERQGGRSTVGLVIHHFVADDLSAHIVSHRLVEIYIRLAQGARAEASPPRLQYTRYLEALTRWIDAGGADRGLEYWVGSLTGAPSTHLRLPGCVEHSFREHVAWRNLVLEPAAVARLDAVCRREEASLAMGLLAILHLSLSKVCGQEDVVVGLVTDGRSGEVSFDDVGRFTNIVLLRERIPDGIELSALIASAKQRYLESMRHWMCPYEVVYGPVYRAGHAWDSPLFSFRDMTSLEADAGDGTALDQAKNAPLGGYGPSRVASAKDFSNFQIAMRRDAGGLSIDLSYLPTLHDADRIEMFAATLLDLCRHCGTEEGPGS